MLTTNQANPSVQYDISTHSPTTQSSNPHSPDIIKVRLQTSNQYTSALDCGRKILTHEGPLAFYKGTLTPLIGIGACVSIQFGAFHYARRHFEESNLKNSLNPSLSYSQYYLSGAFAGLTNSLLSGPIEHVRIRLQTQPHSANPADRLYRGPWDCIRKLSSPPATPSNSLPLSGLYRGQLVTLVREAQAYGVWFLTFEYLMHRDMRRNQRRREEVSSARVALYGGLAGEALWVSSYPFDVVKSKMQSDGFGRSEAPAAAETRAGKGQVQKYASMRDCFAQTWRAEGVRGFWKGIGPTLVRAMPVSAGTFAVVELVMRALG